MHQMQLTAFVGYEEEHIYEYLQLQEDTHFCVVLDRMEDEPVYDPFSIANEFFHAAFAGEQLRKAAKDFSYLVPGEYSTAAFEFEFEVKSLEAFAAAMYYLVRHLGWDEAKEPLKQQYLDDMEAFGKAYSDYTLEPVCAGLLYIYETAMERGAGHLE